MFGFWGQYFPFQNSLFSFVYIIILVFSPLFNFCFSSQNRKQYEHEKQRQPQQPQLQQEIVNNNKKKKKMT